MNVPTFYPIFLKQAKVSIDSRNLKPGEIFFALKGENFNGNSFVEQAFRNGAAYAIVDEEIEIQDSRIFKVNNTLNFLQELANYHRNQFQIPVLAITGSNGKTTTKELVASVLSQKYSCLSTQGNYNNHIGVPLTLLQLSSKNDIAVIEMGANHVGEIAQLSEIANPTHGIITNIGKAHLEGFGSLEGVIKGKTELFKYLNLNNGIIFLDKDNPHLASKVAKENVVEYSEIDPNAETFGQLLSGDPVLSFEYKYKKGKSNKLDTNLAGNYNLKNCLAAISIGMHFQVPEKKINESINNYLPQNIRSQWVKTEKNNVLLDAYNANPDSMRCAIMNFSELEKTNKLLIIGEMLELGKYSSQEHEQIISLLKLFNFETVYLVGKAFQDLKQHSYQTFISVEEVKSHLKETNPIQASILIKGSRGVRLEVLLEVL